MDNKITKNYGEHSIGESDSEPKDKISREMMGSHTEVSKWLKQGVL